MSNVVKFRARFSLAERAMLKAMEKIEAQQNGGKRMRIRLPGRRA